MSREFEIDANPKDLLFNRYEIIQKNKISHFATAKAMHDFIKVEKLPKVKASLNEEIKRVLEKLKCENKNILFLLFVIYYLPMMIAILIILITGIYFNKMNEKRDQISNSYKNERIEKLINLLNEKRYNLNIGAGIDALVKYCEEKIDKSNILKAIRNIGKYSSVIIIPIFLLYFKTVFDNLGESISEVLGFLT